MKSTFVLVVLTVVLGAQPRYDLLLQGGHVIDPKNNISAAMDVAIRDGKIAAVAGHIEAAQAFKTVNVRGTTVADAGCSGYRNFEDFKQRIIDRSSTRVLAFLNIVGHGMRGPKYENDLSDMEAKPAAEIALRNKGIIVGIKTAHYSGPEWTPVEHAVEAGMLANIPVMVDFGANRPERPMSELVTKKLRPGDIYTH